jgi:hypothetical protein
LSCSGALSLTVTASSNAPNTLTVTAPASSQVISTGTQPSIITYGTSAGVWKLTDVSQGNRAIIHWSPNGANCTQEVPTQ